MFAMALNRSCSRDAIGQLARRQQDAVVLYYLLDMDVTSIASTLGISSGTVKTALSRARGRLGALLVDREMET